MVVSDSGVKGRVRGLLATPPGGPEGVVAMDPPSDPAAAQHQALHVLTLAQRTAEEHLGSARHEADRICADARDTAAQIVRDAQAHAEALRREAEAAVSEARAAATQAAREAQAEADQARRDAEQIRSEAHTRADEVAKHAQAEADELQQLAQQRYEDVVGSLAAKREALQQQIEALERFDRDYRARLQSFMQSQLRALWVDEPRVDEARVDEARVDVEGPEHPISPPPAQFVPAQPTSSDQFAGASPDS